MSTARAPLALALVCLAASCAPAAPAEAPRAEPPPAPAAPPPACPTAAPPAAPEPASIAPRSLDPQAIDRYLAHEVKERGLVGIQVALVRGGEVVLAKGYGKSAAAADGLVDNETAFAIGSVTKQFTCAAALLLADDGKLKVTDKVAKYYPDLTRAADITLHDLLTHVSGYPDYYPLDFVDRDMARPIAPDALIERFARRKLDFEPRTRWSYSNTGFVIAGRVVEKVAREPIGAFLAKRVFGPLRMSHTRLAERRDPAEKGVATGHASFALGAPEAAAPEGDGWLHGAGGMVSTAEDLAKWDLALVDGKILAPRTRELMLTPRRLADGSTRAYACGIGVSQRRGETVLGHSGAVSGFLAYNLVIPRTRSAVVLLANSESARAGALHDELVGLVLKAGGRSGMVVPTVTGPAPEVIAREIIKQMQAGKLDRGLLGEEFSAHMSEARVSGAAERLRALGEPSAVEVEDVSERGGMEVASIKIVFKTATAVALLYRTPDGKVQELLLSNR